MGTTEQQNKVSPGLQKVLLTIAKDQDGLTPGDGADADCKNGELDHDEPPDGQGEGQPDGDSVDHDAEVGVEQEEDCPGVRKLKRILGVNEKYVKLTFFSFSVW